MAKKSATAWVALIALVLALLVGILGVMNVTLPIDSAWILIILSVAGMYVGFSNRKADVTFLISTLVIAAVGAIVSAVFGSWLQTILTPITLVVGSIALATALKAIYKKLVK